MEAFENSVYTGGKTLTAFYFCVHMASWVTPSPSRVLSRLFYTVWSGRSGASIRRILTARDPFELAGILCNDLNSSVPGEDHTASAALSRLYCRGDHMLESLLHTGTPEGLLRRTLDLCSEAVPHRNELILWAIRRQAPVMSR